MDRSNSPAGGMGLLAAQVDGLAVTVKAAADAVESVDWTTALEALGALERDTDSALHVAVSAARRAGWSWRQIGPVLGMREQSAWRRFTNPRRSAVPGGADGRPRPTPEEEIR